MNTSNFSESEPTALPVAQKSSTPELKWTLTMEKDRTIFESQYGTLVSSLASDLKLQPAFMRSLIAHESRFEERAKNIHGSKGFMQLTSAPINDFLARPHFFAPAMKKITIPSGAPVPLIDLKKAFDSDPVNKKEISRVVPLLQWLKFDPIVNLVIGHVFFAALEAREGLKIGQREDKMGATINTITSNKSLLAHVFRRVGHLLPWVSPEEVEGSLKWLVRRDDMKSQFLAIKDYNGNNHSYGSGIVHSDIYTCVIMSVQELASKNPKYWAKILPAQKPPCITV